MIAYRYTVALIFALFAHLALAEAPQLGAALPALVVNDKGEIIVEGDDFKFIPWRSDTNPGKVHVVQYFGATMGDSKIFEPLTDRLQTSLEPGTVHVSTVINLDAAMWGTTGFVVSEIKKNKRKHPQSTIVLDEDGTGTRLWGLGKKGRALAVLDVQGIVKYFTTRAMSAEELESTLELIRAQAGI